MMNYLEMEGQIRKERQATIYKQQKIRKQIGEAIAILFVVAIIGGFLALLGTVYINRAQGDGLIESNISISKVE